MDDSALLADYVARRNEAAFAELVSRHFNHVHATALRLVRDPALAQDVAQCVFLQLARRAGSVRDGAALGGWLYRAARGVALDTIRGERRRRAREEEAVKLARTGSGPQADWETIAPILDDAMAHLKPEDQDAIILRFFLNKSLREVGDVLQLSDDAAQKRVARALERMRGYFAHRGVATTAALLAAAMPAHAAGPAPAGLAASVAGSSLAGAAGEAVAGKMLAGTSAQGFALAAALVLLALPLAWQTAENERLRGEIAQAQRNADAPTAGIASAKAAATARLSDEEIERQVTLAVGQRSADTSRSWGERMGDGPWAAGWIQFVNRIMPEDLPRVAAIAARVPYPDTQQGLLKHIVSRWASVNPLAAIRFLDAIPDAERFHLLREAVDSWAGVDLAAAKAWVEQLPRRDALPGERGTDGFRSAAEFRDNTIYPVVRRMAGRDAPAAFEWLAAQSSHSTLISISYDAVFRHWPADKFPQAAANLETLHATDRFYAVSDLASGWAGVDARAAIQWAMSLTAGQERGMALSAAGQQWMKQDPAAALAWAENLAQHDAAAGRGAFDTLLQGWVYHNPAAALAYLDTLPAGERSESLRDMCLTLWAGTDLAKAGEYVAAMPEGPAQDKAALSFLGGWAMRNATLDEGQLDAAAWAATLPEDLQARAFGTIAYQWKDPAAVEAWINTLPPGKPRNNAMYNYVVHQRDFYPWLAPLAESLPPSQDRNIAMHNIAEYWLRQDRAAATEWIMRGGFTDKQRARLLGDGGVPK